MLRPEALESFYYAYRATGNPVYQDWAWNAIVAINATTRTGHGFHPINDVNVVGGGGFVEAGFMHSYFFAETLKYAWLIHAPDAEYQVNYGGKNRWVFNTEGHPLKVVGPPV